MGQALKVRLRRGAVLLPMVGLGNRMLQNLQFGGFEFIFKGLGFRS